MTITDRMAFILIFAMCGSFALGLVLGVEMERRNEANIRQAVEVTR